MYPVGSLNHKPNEQQRTTIKDLKYLGCHVKSISLTLQNLHDTMGFSARRILRVRGRSRAYSSSLSSSSSPAAALVAVFFFFFLGLFALGAEALLIGCSRILRISSSVIFLSVFSVDKAGSGGPTRRVIPFLVIATPRQR
jgi:hypothetical protein